MLDANSANPVSKELQPAPLYRIASRRCNVHVLNCRFSHEGTFTMIDSLRPQNAKRGLLQALLLSVVVVLPLTVESASAQPNNIKGLGYLSGYEEPPDSSGVTVHKPAAWEAYNVWVSADGPIARLIDMEGTILHRWKIPFNEIFPSGDPEFHPHRPKKDHFRKVVAYPNGDLLVVWENLGLARINAQSEVKWAHLNWAHHEVDRDPAGNIYVLVKNRRRVNFRDTSVEVADEAIAKYTPKGKKIAEFSIWDAFKDSTYYGLNEFALIWVRGDKKWDIYHTNSVEVIPPRHRSLYGGGDLLITPLNTLSIVAIDTDSLNVTWAMTGRASRLHDATILDNGNVLFFDNGFLAQQSGVHEINPRTRRLEWTYSKKGLLSPCCGTAQRLPNGNTLVTSTGEGRAFQVTKEGEVVWEYKSPFRVGRNKNKIAAMHHMTAYSKQYFTFLD